MLGLAEGTLSEDEFAAFLRTHVQAVRRVQEAKTPRRSSRGHRLSLFSPKLPWTPAWLAIPNSNFCASAASCRSS